MVTTQSPTLLSRKFGRFPLQYNSVQNGSFMADFILIDGDTVVFMPSVGSATVVVQPGTISGSGAATINDKAMCVEGDEEQVSVPGCAYISGSFTIPGTGTLKISSLAQDQVATKTTSGDKAVLLKGSTFTSKFEVQSPAKSPPPGTSSPIPDPMTEYTGGSGTFPC